MRPPLWRKRCAHEACRRMFACRLARTRFCSRRCAALGAPRGFYAGHGRHGGIASGQERLARALGRVAALWPGMPVAAVHIIRAELQREYNSGHKTGRRAGWREALKESA